MILTRPVPSTGEQLPVVGLGTWRTFDGGNDPAVRAQLKELLASFAALGGTLVDTSPMYGRAEDVVGDLMASLGLRERLFLATKVWTSGKQAGIRQMEASAEKLRSGTLDLLQVHNLVDVETHLETLREWKASGRVRYIGITHYTEGGHAPLARLLASQQLDVVQINYSLEEREAEQRILPLARERGVAVIVNRPFAGGRLAAQLMTKPLPPWAADIGCEHWTELMLKFVLSHPAVTCAIPATSSLDHLRSNMRAGQGPLPDAAFRDRIAQAAGVRVI